MRQKRAKAYRKLMALYSLSFGFRQPYQILIDSEMCKSAIDLKLELVKQLGTILQGEIKPMITQCCIHELYLQGKGQQQAVDLAKTFERRKCNHREPIPGDECLTGVVGDTNKHRYVIATQSHPLRVKLRSVPAAPIVHVNRSVMVLEPPSDVTIKAKEAAEDQALFPAAPDMVLIGSSKPVKPAPFKKKGPKGPNPLSMKKKKIEPVFGLPNVDGKRRQYMIDITPATSKSMPGEKRKREASDDGDENPHPEQQPTISEEKVTGKKRKRRRKTAMHLASNSDVQ